MEREAAALTLRAIEQFEHECRTGLADLGRPEMIDRIAARVAEAMSAGPAELALEDRPAIDIRQVVRATIDKVVEFTIEIPQIVVLPDRTPTYSFRDFNLTGLSAIAFQPTTDRLLLQDLRTEHRRFLDLSPAAAREERLENYIARHLIDFNEISYDEHAELLFKLSAQMIAHLRSYLPDDEAVENVLLGRGPDLARFIASQMLQDEKRPHDYAELHQQGDPRIHIIETQAYNIPPGSAVHDVRRPPASAADIRRIVFAGFKKCCYPYQKFDSEPERAFAALLDDASETEVIRWMKPAPRQFDIEYEPGRRYEPDLSSKPRSRSSSSRLSVPTSSPILSFKRRRGQHGAMSTMLRVMLPRTAARAGFTLCYLMIS